MGRVMLLCVAITYDDNAIRSDEEITILRKIPDHVDGGVELLLRRHLFVAEAERTATRCEITPVLCFLLGSKLHATAAAIRVRGYLF